MKQILIGLLAGPVSMSFAEAEWKPCGRDAHRKKLFQLHTRIRMTLARRRRLNLTDDSEKPLGKWNQMRVVTKDATVEVYVNGDLVNKGGNAAVSEGAICLQAKRLEQ